MKFNLKEQIKNKSFWLSVTALLVLTAQQFGLDFYLITSKILLIQL